MAVPTKNWQHGGITIVKDCSDDRHRAGRGVRAVTARPGALASGLRPDAGGDRRECGGNPLLRDGSPAQRRMPCADLSSGEHRSVL